MLTEDHGPSMGLRYAKQEYRRPCAGAGFSDNELIKVG